MIRGLLTIGFLILLTMPATGAANDSSTIDDELAKQIRASARTYIDEHIVGRVYWFYDAVSHDMLKLVYKRLHPDVLKKGDFYVVCADFVSHGDVLDKQKMSTLDIDFLVVKGEHGFHTTQAIVHKIDGLIHSYDLESK